VGPEGFTAADRPDGVPLTLPGDDLRGRTFARILLIKLSAVGDVVQTMPVLNKLRARYPAARIDWLTVPAIAELLRPNPKISNVIIFARDDWRQPWRLKPYASAARLAEQLRAARYDLVLDLQGQFRSGVIARVTGAPVRIGFGRPRAQAWEASARKLPDEARKHAWQGAREGAWLAYTHFIPLPTLDMHAVDRYLGVVPMLELDDGPADFTFPLPLAADGRVDALLRRHGIAGGELVVMAPSANWETKRWNGEKFAAVARHFLDRGCAVALVGAGNEREACAVVAALAPGAKNLAGETTLTELAALVRRARLVVSNDSGPMHLAVALGRPVVSIFGPTDEVWAGPYRRPEAVVRTPLPCAPCYLRKLAKCPNGHACMHDVPASAVIERAEQILAQRSTAAAL
jgi:predicted lipopolysaccharide heptosyltransferase III